MFIIILKNFFIIYYFEILLIQCFCSLDLLLFYITFESILIPMYFLIGCWGARERDYMLLIVFFIYFSRFFIYVSWLIFCKSTSGTTNYGELCEYTFTPYREVIIWLCFFLDFLLKFLWCLYISVTWSSCRIYNSWFCFISWYFIKVRYIWYFTFLLPLFKFSCYYFAPLVYLISLLSMVMLL